MFKLFSRFLGILFLSSIVNLSSSTSANASLFDNYAPGTSIWVLNGLHYGETYNDVCNYTPSTAIAPWNGKLRVLDHNVDGEEAFVICDRYYSARYGGGAYWWIRADRYCVVETTAGTNTGIKFKNTDVGACTNLPKVCYVSSPSEQFSGNPIDAATGHKIETALDWRSPRDNRFSFSRLYRSHGYQNGSQSTDAYGNVWATEWMAAVEGKSYGPNGANSDWHFHTGDGSILGFDASGVAHQPDHEYSLTLSNQGNRMNKLAGDK